MRRLPWLHDLLSLGWNWSWYLLGLGLEIRVIDLNMTIYIEDRMRIGANSTSL